MLRQHAFLAKELISGRFHPNPELACNMIPKIDVRFSDVADKISDVTVRTTTPGCISFPIYMAM